MPARSAGGHAHALVDLVARVQGLRAAQRLLVQIRAVRRTEILLAARIADLFEEVVDGLIGAGATLKWVHDPDPAKVERFVERFPDAKVARSEAEILDDDEVRLVAGAAVTSERCALGLRVMDAGKDYFTDKAPLTTLDQLAAAKEAVARTGKKYAVYYSERIHV